MALLSLHGWGEAEFRRARPGLLEAARFALYSERVIPMLHEWEAVIATAEEVARDLNSQADVNTRAELGARYKEAKRLVPQLRDYLYPED